MSAIAVPRPANQAAHCCPSSGRDERSGWPRKAKMYLLMTCSFSRASVVHRPLPTRKTAQRQIDNRPDEPVAVQERFGLAAEVNCRGACCPDLGLAHLGPGA